VGTFDILSASLAWLQRAETIAQPIHCGRTRRAVVLTEWLRGNAMPEAIIWARVRRVGSHRIYHSARSEKIGLIGRSGAGKSTLVADCCAFRSWKSAAVFLIDGRIITTVRQRLRQAIRKWLQTGQCFCCTGSIARTSFIGRPSAPKQRFDRRRKRHSCFIPGFNDQGAGQDMMTQVEGGCETVSGGQRQTYRFGACFLKNAPILLLDEATAALNSGQRDKFQKP